VYVYRNNRYQLAESIQPYESFFIRSYGEDAMSIDINFYPYFDAPKITPPSPYWNVNVIASGTDEDSFSFGTSPIASNGYDFRMDMPKAPQKSLFPSLYVYRHDPADEAFPMLQEEYRENFANTDPQDMVFSFAIEIPDTTPVNFSFVPLGVPANWTLRFVMEGVGTDITSDAVYEFTAPEAGTYHGYIRVHNHPVSNSDQVQGPITELKAFPNPFNPNTTIMFHNAVNQKVKVDIYNIRGQKVCNIFNGDLASGTKSLGWNGRDSKGRSVASGIYFARIKTQHDMKSIKMMLMK